MESSETRCYLLLCVYVFEFFLSYICLLFCFFYLILGLFLFAIGMQFPYEFVCRSIPIRFESSSSFYLFLLFFFAFVSRAHFTHYSANTYKDEFLLLCVLRARRRRVELKTSLFRAHSEHHHHHRIRAHQVAKCTSFIYTHNFDHL